MTLILGVLTVLFGGMTLWLYHRQTDNEKAAQDREQGAQDRTTGKIRASFEYVEENQKLDPATVKELLKKEVGTNNDILRFESVEDLARWAPHVKVKNTGDVIDGLRVEVNYVYGRAYGFGVTQLEPWPVMMNDVSTAEITTFGKLLPQKQATIFLMPLLLDQMIQTQTGPFPDTDHQGQFRVRVLCKLAGGATYDLMEPSKSMLLTFHWRQTGFKDEKRCKDIIKRQPLVRID